MKSHNVFNVIVFYYSPGSWGNRVLVPPDEFPRKSRCQPEIRPVSARQHPSPVLDKASAGGRVRHIWLILPRPDSIRNAFFLFLGSIFLFLGSIPVGSTKPTCRFGPISRGRTPFIRKEYALRMVCGVVHRPRLVCAGPSIALQHPINSGLTTIARRRAVGCRGSGRFGFVRDGALPATRRGTSGVTRGAGRPGGGHCCGRPRSAARASGSRSGSGRRARCRPFCGAGPRSGRPRPWG
jgi:hypothetical protein